MAKKDTSLGDEEQSMELEALRAIYMVLVNL